jgi:hypothetical protein
MPERRAPAEHPPAQLPWRDWGDTLATLHMWTQVVGKVRMALTPHQNHWWHVALYVSARGLTTGSIPYRDRLIQIDIDLVDHHLTVDDGAERFTLDLEPMSVASFYRRLMEGLASMDITVSIWPRPVEVEVAIPFDEDVQHATYDRDHVRALWGSLSRGHRVLSQFRGSFVGKSSPVHFFWGAFDLAVTRFSGRLAPKHPGGVPNCPDWVMHEAYSHEVSSAGWWPTDASFGPAYYSYMYPEPEGFAQGSVRPEGADYQLAMGEFVLPEDALAESSDPETTILEFLQSTYEAGATLAGWDRRALEVAGEAAGRAG